jgi:hypothetical protein
MKINGINLIEFCGKLIQQFFAKFENEVRIPGQDCLPPSTNLIEFFQMLPK